MGNYGFKITSQSSIAGIVKIVRKYKDYSIADIKSRVDNNEYVFTCNSVDEDECKIMLKCIKELNKAKITTQLYEIYEYDRAIDLQLLKNWLGTCREISHEVDAEIVLESESVNDDAIQEFSYLWTTEQKDWVVLVSKYDYSIVNTKTKQFLLIEDEDLNNQVASMMIMQGNKVIDQSGD